MSTKYNCILLMVFTGLCELCAGITVVENAEEHHILSRIPRRAGLCPKGMSRETCFYSQLNMFMKIHDSMMDPVSLRNIGKRNGAQDTTSSLEESIPADLLTQYQDVLSPDDDGNSLLYTLNSAARQLTSDDRLAILKKLLGEYESHLFEPGSRGDNGVDKSADEMAKRDQPTFLPPQKKRHIICPASMSRIECYDQAMAFYMRLMRSVGKQ